MDQDIKKPIARHTTSRQPTSGPVVLSKHATRNWIYSIIFVTIGVLLTTSYIFLKYRDSSTAESAESIKVLISKHVVLPADEEPAYATITDKNKLETPFLKQAENGDKLLIYQNNQKIIIYRPSIDRIIDIGPVSIADSPQK